MRCFCDSQVSGNLNLNVKAAGHVVEKRIETLSKKKSELADLWTSWQLHYSQIKSVKKQWKKFKDQAKKVTMYFVNAHFTLHPKLNVGPYLLN